MCVCVCVCVCVCTCKYIHLYTHVHVIVLQYYYMYNVSIIPHTLYMYNVCGIIDTLLLLLTVMYCNYSLSSSTLVSLINPTPFLSPPNIIIQLVVGVTLHTERECQHLPVTASGILNYYKNNN